MPLLVQAWRNLWRNRGRSLLTGAVMAFAVSVMILFLGVGDGSHARLIRGATDSWLGHLQVRHAAWEEDPGLASVVSPQALQRLPELLSGIAGVQGFAPRLTAGALVTPKTTTPHALAPGATAGGAATQGALLVGVRPAAEARVSTLAASLLPDDPAARCRFVASCQPARFLASSPPTRPPRAPADPGEALVGSELAHLLGVGVGDELAATSLGFDGRSYARRLRVVGLVRTDSLELNRTAVFVDFDELSADLGLQGAAAAVVIALTSPRRAEEVAATLGARLTGPLAGLVALPWSRLAPELALLVALDQGALLFLLILLVGVVGVIVANSVTMTAFERTREFGVRLALGEPAARIGRGLVLETLLLTLGACVVGAALGEAANLYVQRFGIDFGLGEFEATGVVLYTVYHSEPTWQGLGLAVGTVSGFALLGSLPPAWRLRRLSPVAALRTV